MDQPLADIRPESSQRSSDAAEAFNQLRGEIGLMRRAIEQLISEQRAAPDYSPHFKKHDQDIEALINWCDAISKRPAMTLTPDQYAADIERASTKARSSDHAALAEAVAGIERLFAGNHRYKEMKRVVRLAGGSAFLVGMFLAAALFSVG